MPSCHVDGCHFDLLNLDIQEVLTRWVMKCAPKSLGNLKWPLWPLDWTKNWERFIWNDIRKEAKVLSTISDPSIFPRCYCAHIFLLLKIQEWHSYSCIGVFSALDAMGYVLVCSLIPFLQHSSTPGKPADVTEMSSLLATNLSAFVPS